MEIMRERNMTQNIEKQIQNEQKNKGEWRRRASEWQLSIMFVAVVSGMCQSCFVVDPVIDMCHSIVIVSTGILKKIDFY